MSEEDNWEPDEGLIEWAKQHFASVGVGGVWSPDESGCTYVRQTEDTWALMRMIDHPTAYEHHKRFLKLFEGSFFNRDVSPIFCKFLSLTLVEPDLAGISIVTDPIS